MAEPNGEAPKSEASEAPNGEGVKEMSKSALAKAKKKAEKAAKKAEYALRPKTETRPVAAKSIFDEGWLKKTYEEKPVEHVQTRFPPEPNGFLHIGHAKAIAVNFGMAKHYGGKCYLRYDDTNPEAEKEEYFISIEDMIRWLGFEPGAITYSSDHFDKLYELAEELIRKDKAYVCHCSREEINMQRGGPDNRGARYACEHRTRPVDESLTEFRAMRDGKYKPGEAFLRMKQFIDDPNEGNPQMWDLPAYRILKDNHHYRTGDKWKIYPTYDFTHCIVDALEGTTHSMCTLEFLRSRPSYDWLLEQLEMKDPKSDARGPMQREYGRLSLAGTILSKRRIIKLVEGASIKVQNPDGSTSTKNIPPAVRGWDDPRLFTLVALRRRGVPAQALLQFIQDLGVTDALSLLQPHKFESSIRKYLERTVPRLMLVLDPIKVTIDDLPADHRQNLTVPFDPKNPTGPSRTVPFTKTLYIDRSDFRPIDSPDFFRLAPGKKVGLLHVPFTIRATSFSTNPADPTRVTEIHAESVPEGEGEKPKAYIHWVPETVGTMRVTARLYNALFSAENPNELDWKDGGYAEHLNPESEVVFSEAVIEPAFAELVGTREEKLRSASSDDIVRFQAVRTGYFCVDLESEGKRIVLNQIVSLKEDAGKGK